MYPTKHNNKGKNSLKKKKKFGYSFPFFGVSLSGFGIRIILASQHECGSIPSFSILWNC
jgi:hypothetical protein